MSMVLLYYQYEITSSTIHRDGNQAHWAVDAQTVLVRRRRREHDRHGIYYPQRSVVLFGRHPVASIFWRPGLPEGRRSTLSELPGLYAGLYLRLQALYLSN